MELKQIRMEEIKNPFSLPCAGEELCSIGQPVAVRRTSEGGATPLVMLNPPYGERLKSNKEMEDLYSAIGSTLKHQFAGATAWIISSNDAAMKCIGLKPSRKVRLLNGELDCQFNRYDLFRGKRKDNNQ